MKVKTYIEFEFDDNDADLNFENIEKLKEYAIDCMVDDLYSMVKHNEIREAVRVSVIEENKQMSVALCGDCLISVGDCACPA